MSGKKPTIDEIISKTIQATRLDCAQQPNDVFKATERRLYAYPVIKAKIESDRNMLKSYLTVDKPPKCSAFIRFQKSGVRLSDEEILEMLVQDMRVKIAANEFEIETIDKAMKIIAADPYVKVVTFLYFYGKSVAETSDLTACDRATVFRQKARLVQRLATFLYGVSAL